MAHMTGERDQEGAHVRAWQALGAEGQPATLRAGDVYATTEDGAPTWARFDLAPGRVSVLDAHEPVHAIHALWEVPGFGRVVLRADETHHEAEGPLRALRRVLA